MWTLQERSFFSPLEPWQKNPFVYIVMREREQAEKEKGLWCSSSLEFSLLRGVHFPKLFFFKLMSFRQNGESWICREKHLVLLVTYLVGQYEWESSYWNCVSHTEKLQLAHTSHHFFTINATSIYLLIVSPLISMQTKNTCVEQQHQRCSNTLFILQHIYVFLCDVWRCKNVVHLQATFL